ECSFLLIDWIVYTFLRKKTGFHFKLHLEIRQQRGSLSPRALLLTVSDPQERLGSGGATLNALLVAAEHLSARAGYTVSDSKQKPQLLHSFYIQRGRDFPWDGCSRAFCWMPIAATEQSVEGPVCCLDMLLDCLSTKVCVGSPPGVWVCSTDMILILPTAQSTHTCFSGVRVMSLPGDVSFAANHGVYLTDTEGGVRDIVYRGSEKRIRSAVLPDGKVPLVSGPVFFSRSVSERLLQTHVTPPLDGCTYLGMDSGAPPLQISLFLDVLMCLCSEMTETEFVNGERTGCSSPLGPQGAAVKSARSVLWKTLRGVPLSLVYIPDGRYDYLTMSGREHVVRLTDTGTERQILSHIQVIEGSRVINTVLEGSVRVAAGAVVQHCRLQGPIQVQPGCLLSGLDLNSSTYLQHMPLTSDIILQGHRVQLGELKLTVFTVLGAYDSLEAAGSFLNQTWSQFYSRTGIKPEELWAADSGLCRSLLDARLFPVFMPKGGPVGMEGVSFLLGGSGSAESWRAAWRLSLREVLSLTDQQGELHWREELFFSAGRRRAEDTLKGHTDHNLLPSIRAAVLGGQQGELLQTLDSVASGSSSDLGIAARSLACIADVLGCLAGEGRGGLRSGPAANPSWASAFSLLEQGKLVAGVQELAKQRVLWLNRSASPCGWSDTPPIAFEHGGVVVNVAVRVDGKRPIGARVRRIPKPHLVLVSTSGPPDCSVTTETVCEVLADLEDYCQPHAPGALLKAVCVCSDVVFVSSSLSLEQQLLERWGGGLEVHTWSLLPHGSGLGTSSILAGAVLAGVYRCTGRSYDTSSLIHAVLYLEQILTTGGGWQDQVGGLVGGVKVARSHATLPLRVDVEQLSLPQDFLSALQQRLLLIYTGKTRLARNLLQDVVRNWYSRLPAIVQNAEQLVSNAEDCARACSEGSLSGVGACIERYWQQKKAMAPGCEPAAVRTMMNALQPLTLGQSLAGAGGGGFLFILTRHAQQEENVRQILSTTQGLGDFTVHSVELDMDGITVLQKSREHAQ
uniref:L-fucose kinase n=1 Tax=Pygocentrus nattereri TaxID=42514 RepID=A0AAR2J8J5_PYGNA